MSGFALFKRLGFRDAKSATSAFLNIRSGRRLTRLLKNKVEMNH